MSSVLGLLPCLTSQGQWIKIVCDTAADVVELADALGSGSSGRNPVGVQVPPSAHDGDCSETLQSPNYFGVAEIPFGSRMAMTG